MDRAEVRAAINRLKNQKAPGVDNITAKELKEARALRPSTDCAI